MKTKKKVQRKVQRFIKNALNDKQTKAFIAKQKRMLKAEIRQLERRVEKRIHAALK